MNITIKTAINIKKKGRGVGIFRLCLGGTVGGTVSDPTDAAGDSPRGGDGDYR